MSKHAFSIQGGKKLTGTVMAGGSKNATFPVLAAIVLASGKMSLRRVPRILDVLDSLNILSQLGISVQADDEDAQTFHLDIPAQIRSVVPQELGSKIRGSLYFLGALLARTGSASIPLPGGGDIGDRGFELHVEAMRKLGAEVWVTDSMIEARCEQLVGTNIRLPFPSRGVSGNVLLAATRAAGVTVLENANTSPEIINLGRLLISMGAKIEGLGTDVIRITGDESLLKKEQVVMPPDKIEIGTLLLAGVITGGEVTVEGVILEDLKAFLDQLEAMNIPFELGGDRVTVRSSAEIRGASLISALPPAIDPDYEPLLAALLCLLPGTHTIFDDINPERHSRFLPELEKMGAKIKVIDNATAEITGVTALQPSENLHGKDIRGSVSLILAALATPGHSTVYGAEQVDRGYEQLEEKLRLIGARIDRVKLAGAVK